jgi:hypothetical protein
MCMLCYVSYFWSNFFRKCFYVLVMHVSPFDPWNKHNNACYKHGTTRYSLILCKTQVFV